MIALTHMRWPNDIRLAEEAENIDLILGGHDHEYGLKEVDKYKAFRHKYNTCIGEICLKIKQTCLNYLI